MSTEQATRNEAARLRDWIAEHRTVCPIMRESARELFDVLNDELDEALATERRNVVEQVRRGLWFLNPTQQAEANKVFDSIATGTEEEEE